jgi:hypothetical protein
MIDFLLLNQALMREIINGVAFILLLTLTLMITVFLWDTAVKEWPKSMSDWWKVPGVHTACALFWIFAAEAYRTCNVWITYNLGKVADNATLSQSIGVGMFSASSVASTIGYLAAGVIFCLGLARAIYIFTPPEWKHRVWIYASVGAGIFVSMPTIFNIFGE